MVFLQKGKVTEGEPCCQADLNVVHRKSNGSDSFDPGQILGPLPNPKQFVWVLYEIHKLILEILFWWLNGGVTPVLIPNTEVKLASGDGSRGHTRRE